MKWMTKDKCMRETERDKATKRRSRRRGIKMAKRHRFQVFKVMRTPFVFFSLLFQVFAVACSHDFLSAYTPVRSVCLQVPLNFQYHVVYFRFSVISENGTKMKMEPLLFWTRKAHSVYACVLWLVSVIIAICCGVFIAMQLYSESNTLQTKSQVLNVFLNRSSHHEMI